MSPLRIYHTADLHDRRGFAGRIRAYRAAEPGLYFDCGDALRGSQTRYVRDEGVVRELAAAGCDAQALGNREFHYLFGLLVARARAMPYPLVCANLVDRRERSLPFAPALDFEWEGRPLRIFGLAVVEYREGSPWERLFGWRFLDPIACARALAERTPPGVALVALSHLGLAGDRALAAAVPRLDLILGGHSHDTLPQPELRCGVPIVHAGPYGRYLSRSELARDASGRARLERAALLPLLARA